MKTLTEKTEHDLRDVMSENIDIIEHEEEWIIDALLTGFTLQISKALLVQEKWTAAQGNIALIITSTLCKAVKKIREFAVLRARAETLECDRIIADEYTTKAELAYKNEPKHWSGTDTAEGWRMRQRANILRNKVNRIQKETKAAEAALVDWLNTLGMEEDA